MGKIIFKELFTEHTPGVFEFITLPKKEQDKAEKILKVLGVSYQLETNVRTGEKFFVVYNATPGEYESLKQFTAAKDY